LDATFFRRLAEGVLDEEDLIFRAQELADFIVAHLREHNFTDIPVVAVGYSNGANIAASLLLLHPGVLRGAILFRAMLPLTPAHPVSLAEVHVLLAAGARDAMVPVKMWVASPKCCASVGRRWSCNGIRAGTNCTWRRSMMPGGGWQQNLA